MAVDIEGLPHFIHITTADINDREGALMGLSSNKDSLSAVKNILADAGYTGENFAKQVQKVLGCGVEIAKRSEMHKFAVIPKRWVVERSFAWLDKCRRLWKNCERKLNTSFHMVSLAFIALILRRS